MMVGSYDKLQSETGYIDARPHRQIEEISCNARPDHTLGQTWTSADVCGTTASPPEADMTESLRDVAGVPSADIQRICQLCQLLVCSNVYFMLYHARGSAS